MKGVAKQEQILETAIKRFTHFGLQKTTMTEIAGDLSISKPSLFYYFPDKSSLVKAVEEKITGEYIQALNKELGTTETIEAGLTKLIEVKNGYFEKYYLLVSQVEHTDALFISKVMMEVKQSLREREIEVLATLLKKGIETGELKPLDPLKIVNLLLDTLAAFAQCVRDKTFPEKVDFKNNTQKQKEVIQVFYNGLKR
jgi:TetR/AcrR family transcriptional regulator